ncbi:hypothetical protein MUK42_37718 [Musa troglodytarum]|uniref:Uncharacterized protein n=1 Tax=Musa troglodytarum TaxID=320322 RepID=A0A9E7FKG8_9LILI|nr:hypothetical protein MUK42_37718 [Musa troglodytarum]
MGFLSPVSDLGTNLSAITELNHQSVGSVRLVMDHLELMAERPKKSISFHGTKGTRHEKNH